MAVQSMQVPAVPAQAQPTNQPVRQAAEAAQPPSPQELAKILQKSHHRGAAVPRVLGFTATLKVVSLGKKNDKITVEIDGSHTFEYNADLNPGADALGIFAEPYVVEERGNESLTLHPVSRVTAVYLGEVPERRVGFPNIPSA